MAPRRHDHDAGGDRRVLDEKGVIREMAWQAIVDAGVGRFPAPTGRIPNFVGAEAAAERLRDHPAWQAAATVKANPDSPQWPVRQRALEDGKVVYMAVPRLAGPDPFFCLDPAALTVAPRKASSIKGASAHAITVSIDELEPVDLVVTGCVAVDRSGARLGKGGGFSDLEYALAGAAGLIGPDTVVVTTVHDVQVLEAGRIPVVDHDFGLHLIVTPTEVIECPRRRTVPTIHWDELTPDKIASIPVLGAMADEIGRAK